MSSAPRSQGRAGLGEPWGRLRTCAIQKASLELPGWPGGAAVAGGGAWLRGPSCSGGNKGKAAEAGRSGCSGPNACCCLQQS